MMIANGCHRCAYVFASDEAPDGVIELSSGDDEGPHYRRTFCGECWVLLEPRIVKAIQNALVASFRDEPELPA